MGMDFQEAAEYEVLTARLVDTTFDNLLKSKFNIRDVCFKPEHTVSLFGENFRPDYILFSKKNGTVETPLLVFETKRAK
jgi:hypothetical protein